MSCICTYTTCIQTLRFCSDVSPECGMLWPSWHSAVWSCYSVEMPNISQLDSYDRPLCELSGAQSSTKRENSSLHCKAIMYVQYLNKHIELISTGSLYLGSLAVLQLAIHCISQVNKAACGEPVNSCIQNQTVRQALRQAQSAMSYVSVYLGITSLPMTKLVMNFLVYWTRGKLKTQPTGE